MISSQSQMALLYNDTAVLENHHAATTFALLQVFEIVAFASDAGFVHGVYFTLTYLWR